MKTDIVWVKSGLGIIPGPEGGEQPEGQIEDLKAEGVEVLVSVLPPEEQGELGLEDVEAAAKSAGLEFFHHPIEEEGTPESKREFKELVEEVLPHLRSGERVVIQSRRGLGRAALTAASIMALTGFPVGLSFQRIGEACGHEVPDNTDQRLWVSEFLSYAL